MNYVCDHCGEVVSYEYAEANDGQCNCGGVYYSLKDQLTVIDTGDTTPNSVVPKDITSGAVDAPVIGSDGIMHCKYTPRTSLSYYSRKELLDEIDRRMNS